MLFSKGHWRFCLVALIAIAKTSFAEHYCFDDDDESCTAADDVPCGVFMGPSTIAQDANLGIYTGVDLKDGDVVNYPEIVVPLMFRSWGDHGDNPDGTLWDRYIWENEVTQTEPTKSDLRRSDVSAVFIPGVGCTVNSRLEMNNIHSTHGSIYDTAGLHRSKDPGAGASTPYHASRTTARRDVEAGEELFAAYGDTWIPEIPGAIITFDKNMDKADDFLDEYKEWVDKHSDLSPSVKEGLWDLTAKSDLPTRNFIFSAMPQHSWKAVSEEMEERRGGNSTSRHFVNIIGKRTTQWLHENAKCQDHIKPGKSTIPQASWGAFAARDLPKGTVVGYSPLIHIGKNRKILNIKYKGEPFGKKYKMEDLVINYSFKHPNSTLLLTPYGALVNYINHSREKANLRLAWPKKELVAHKPNWLKKDLNFLANTHEKIGLSWDFVATRDLKEGEELFLDYGDEWIAAWEKHVKNWKPIKGAKKYVHASDWKEPYLRTVAELEEKPYPSNLITLCHQSYRRSKKRNVFVPPIPMRILNSRVYCSVISRSKKVDKKTGKDKYTYTVKLKKKSGKSVVVHGYDDTGVQLYDKILSQDWHLPNAFRHPIGIPDDIMPDNWKSVK